MASWCFQYLFALSFLWWALVYAGHFILNSYPQFGQHDLTKFRELYHFGFLMFKAIFGMFEDTEAGLFFEYEKSIGFPLVPAVFWMIFMVVIGIIAINGIISVMTLAIDSVLEENFVRITKNHFINKFLKFEDLHNLLYPPPLNLIQQSFTFLLNFFDQERLERRSKKITQRLRMSDPEDRCRIAVQLITDILAQQQDRDLFFEFMSFLENEPESGPVWTSRHCLRELKDFFVFFPDLLDKEKYPNVHSFINATAEQPPPAPPLEE